MSEKLRLNLGCGRKLLPGYVNVDVDARTGCDVVVDLWSLPWPWDDGAVAEVFSEHLFEHVPHTVEGVRGEFFHAFMREVHRVLEPGGLLVVRVPYWRDENANHGDHTHTRRVSGAGWRHFTGAGGVPDYGLPRFEPVKTYVSDWVGRRPRWLTDWLCYHLPFHRPPYHHPGPNLHHLWCRPREITYVLRKA